MKQYVAADVSPLIIPAGKRFEPTHVGCYGIPNSALATDSFPEFSSEWTIGAISDGEVVANAKADVRISGALTTKLNRHKPLLRFVDSRVVSDERVKYEDDDCNENGDDNN